MEPSPQAEDPASAAAPRLSPPTGQHLRFHPAASPPPQDFRVLGPAPAGLPRPQPRPRWLCARVGAILAADAWVSGGFLSWGGTLREDLNSSVFSPVSPCFPAPPKLGRQPRGRTCGRARVVGAAAEPFRLEPLQRDDCALLLGDGLAPAGRRRPGAEPTRGAGTGERRGRHRGARLLSGEEPHLAK